MSYSSSLSHSGALSYSSPCSSFKVSNKIVKDCIYGHVEIPPLCLAFMDTPEFQRLRRVRQLGVAHFAYPSAVHTRFEHSLGVMHLTGKFVDHLRNFVQISSRMKELIQLAGLYHDIGHLAFSHLFDLFLSRLPLEADIPSFFEHREHEDRSLYFVRSVNKRLQLLTDEEVEFVCNCIRGVIPQGHPPYLYEIVCNRDCGLDIDRMDYIYRDSYHTAFSGFQSDYIIRGSLIDSSGHIAFKSKLKGDIGDLFMARQRMHEKVYQHHASLKMNKLYYCLMKRLGRKLYMYGEKTDDYNIETLFRNSPETVDLINEMDNRELDHNCEICQDYVPVRMIKQSGCIENVRFV